MIFTKVDAFFYFDIACVPIDECSSNPCLNGGTCEDAADSYFCSCPSGFTGDRCETSIHSCYGQICQNNGIFHIEFNSFYCVCTDGFTGQRCEIDVDDCNVLNCQNGGSCQMDEMNNYTCICPDGFNGAHCETEIKNDTTLQGKNFHRYFVFVNVTSKCRLSGMKYSY